MPNGSVLGIDGSSEMIETAKQRSRDNLVFSQMDINRIHFHNEFNVIFSNATLHWIRDHKKLLYNSFMALKEGGMLLWDFAGDGNCSNFYEVVQEKIQDENYKPYFNNFE